MKQKIIAHFSNIEYAKLKKQKKTDGYDTASWEKWLLSKAPQNIFDTEAEAVQRGTKTLRKMWHMNIGHNLAFIRRKGVKNLRDLAVAENKGSALVIAGGPSIHIHDHLNVIKKSGYKGAIVASDRMLIPCLMSGIIPNYVMTVDGADIILKFYKHRLFRENLKSIKVLLHYTASPKVVRYLYRLKADVYWFIVHTEQVVRENSDVLGAIYMTMTAHNPEGLQTLVAGGNVGVCTWAFSWVILNRNPVILVGFDMGYPEGTDLRKTYYYSTIFDATLAALKEPTEAALAAHMQYTKEYNPAWKCYDSQTEVLTRSGWKYFNDVTYDDEVITLNPETKMFEYQKPTSIIKQNYKGKMYKLETRIIDLLVTPNHSMFIAPCKNIPKKRGRWELRVALECYGKHLFYKRDGLWDAERQEYFTLPSVTWNPSGSGTKRWKKPRVMPPLKVCMDDWLKFFGFWLAEGCTKTISKNYRSEYCVEVGNTDRQLITEQKETLTALGFHVQTYSKTSEGRRDYFTIRVQNKQLYTYLSKFGKSHEKYIPTDLKNLEKKQLSVLFEWYMKGDGSTDKFGHQHAATVSSKLVNDLQEIALKMGMAAVISRQNSKMHIFQGRVIKSKHVLYRIDFTTIWKEPRVYAKRSNWERKHYKVKFIEEWVDYNGEVYCLEVPKYHILYVRRNGKPVWCGNSHTYTDSVFRSYREMFCAYLEHAPPKLININCTEGGALYHSRLQYGKLSEILEKYRE